MAQQVLSLENVKKLIERRGLQVIEFYYEPQNDTEHVRIKSGEGERRFQLPFRRHEMTLADFDDTFVDSIAKAMAA